MDAGHAKKRPLEILPYQRPVKSNRRLYRWRATAVVCYDESGKPLDSKACEEREAEYGSNEGLEQLHQPQVKPDVPVKMGAPVGEYTVVVQFVVDKDGSIDKDRTPYQIWLWHGRRSDAHVERSAAGGSLPSNLV